MGDRRRNSVARARAPASSRLLLLTVLVAGVAASFDAGAVDDQIPQVTIESARDAQRLQHDVDAFVSGAMTKSWDESLPRWDQPICPLVAEVKVCPESIVEEDADRSPRVHLQEEGN